MKARIYHNPACSKSRAAPALLREHNADVEIGERAKDGRPPEEILELLR